MRSGIPIPSTRDFENLIFPERVTGIGPVPQPWEGRVLPLYYTRINKNLLLFSFPPDKGGWGVKFVFKVFKPLCLPLSGENLINPLQPHKMRGRAKGE